MATEIFISWSGKLSQKLAEQLNDWLPCVIQSTKPFLTSEDINKGSRWESEISGALDKADIGIVCLTRENLDRPWLLFEAGALSLKFVKSYVCPLLFGLKSTDVKPPLSIFQHTEFNKSDFKKLVGTINQAGKEDPLSPKTLDRLFEKFWPEIERPVNRILKDYQPTPQLEIRSERDILEEILELTRSAGSVQIHPFWLASKAALNEVIVNLSQLNFALDAGDLYQARRFSRQIDAPLRELFSDPNYHLFLRYYHEVREEADQKESKINDENQSAPTNPAGPESGNNQA